MANPTKFKFNAITGGFDIITDTDAEGLTFNAPIISSTVPVSPVTGQQWMTDTLNVKLADSTLQVGQEMYIACINQTGAPIAEASIVYQSGFSGNYQAITKAKADAEVTHHAIGMTTNTVGIGATCNVTTFGLVNGLDTTIDSEGNALTAGDPLYLSATAAGGYTKNIPLDSYYAVEIGYVVSVNALTGSIFIDVKHDASRDLSLVTKEPTGFDNPSAVTVTYDSTEKKITLGGTFKVYWRGSLVTAIAPGYVSVAHSATLDKLYFLYYDGTSIAWSETVWTFDQVMIAAVWYGTNEKFAFRECHGMMEWNTHQELHRVIGTYRSSGGTLSDYDLASAAADRKRPVVSSCTINDEDIPTVNTALNTKLYRKMYLTGTSASPIVNFTSESAEIVPMNTGITLPAYNTISVGAWTQAAMTNNSYQAVWIIAFPMTADTDSQSYRFAWMQGQTISTTLSVIQALTPADLTLGNLSNLANEYIFITKIIIQYVGPSTNNWVITSVQNLTGNRFVQTASGASVYLSAVEHDASLTGDGSIANPLATAYTPAVAADWDVTADPVTPNSALDKIASQGVVKVQAKNKAYIGPISGADALPTFRTLVSDDVASSPIAGYLLKSGATTAAPTWASQNTALSDVVDLLGDLVYCDNSTSDTVAALAGNTTTTKKFLSQTGNGSISAVPSWEVPDAVEVAYAPTTTADWETDPTTTEGGLDTLATSGIVKKQAANKVLSGPTTGADALPAFRTLVAEDIATGTPTAGTIPVSTGAGAKPVWQSLTTTASTTSYTPVLTASAGTAPTNYSSTGYWFTVADQCFVEAEVTFIGSGNASDAGIFRISLPNSFTANATAACIGKGEIIDTSTGFRYNATVKVGATNAYVTVSVTDENADLSYLVPVTLVNTDVIKIQFNFQATQLVSAQVIDTTLLTPRGVILPFAGADAQVPAGWLLCNGAEVSQATYASLWTTVFNSTHIYGADPGGGNFLLPDLRNKMPLGKGTTYSTLGAVGGASSVTIGETNLPNHRHTTPELTHDSYTTDTGGVSSTNNSLDDHTHNQTIASASYTLAGAGGASGLTQFWNASTTAAVTSPTSTEHQHILSISITKHDASFTGYIGSGTALTTISPYIVLNYIIKY